MDGEENKYRKYPLNPDNQQIFDYLKNQIKRMPINEVNRKLKESKVIPFLGGRPERNTIIDRDAIADLKIALNTCDTFEKFFELV